MSTNKIVFALQCLWAWLKTEKKVGVMLKDIAAAIQMVIIITEFLGSEAESFSPLVFLLERVSQDEA